MRNVAPEAELLTLTRYPAAAVRDGDETDSHIVADETEPDLKVGERAAAVTRHRVLARPDADLWARSTLTANPGARLAVTATHDGFFAVVRGTGSVQVAGEDGDVAIAASAIYCCWLSGSLRDRELTVRAGRRALRLSLKFTPE
ncbi:hypothetical protein [Amycolatopsis sp. SID8362]|uniref:hypothetical protein n=1 Tax=Amycolatopsis sp. SID8362 TaxID=2690346 RepID=UPI0013718E28|nr:hypothetical protein [Amycolatopsis sp. SID8362]NBH02904.1 hypothetical protein [Amycolatopsis sp. SID8362]NED39605.1 hypothetical protein [Amycolatopsis sp. SID8362]